MTQGVTERLVYALDRALLDGTTTVAVKKFRCTTLRAEDAQSYMREIATLRYRRDTHLVAQTTPFPSSHALFPSTQPTASCQHYRLVRRRRVATMAGKHRHTAPTPLLPHTHTPRPPNSALSWNTCLGARSLMCSLTTVMPSYEASAPTLATPTAPCSQTRAEYASWSTPGLG